MVLFGSRGRPPGEESAVGGSRLEKLLWRLGVLNMAFLGACVALPMLILQMEAPALVVLPLTLVIAALSASLAAGWFGTFCAPDRTRTRLLPVVGAAEAAAAAAALASVAVSFALEGVEDVMLVLPSTVALTVATSWAAWRFRGPGDRMGWDASLALLAAAALVLVVLMPTLVLGAPLVFLAAPEASHALVAWSAPSSGLAGVIAGTILLLRFRRRGDPLGVDAAATLCLVGLAPLLVVGTLGVVDLVLGVQ